MCWSFGASSILALIGFAVAITLACRKKDFAIWLPLGYFGLMELLQALTYLVIGECSSPANQLLTVLGYLHVSFQPFFINLFAMYFLPMKIRKKIAPYVYALCFVAAVLLLLKLYPFSWAGTCQSGVDVFCGEQVCSKSGEWHLAWYIPLNGIPHLGLIGYTLMTFLLPLLYGSWRVILFHALVGPLPAFLLTSNVNEWPAIWCLFSVGIVLVAFCKPLREKLRVKKWYFWEFK